MRINHNLSALNAWRALSQTDNAMTKSLEKLSSGLRINRAADDAAGLAISEKMRGQIRGLNQAIRNAQDAISLIQTAEGALNETHSILQRMRELAVQAATDTNTDDDRFEIQKEIDQLAQELTRIANTTEFNTKTLLDGSFTGTFHIGANKDQNINLTIGAMDAVTLGVGTQTTTGGAKATGTLGGVSFEANTAGTGGNSIKVVFEKPDDANQSLNVSVSGNTITVSLATDESSNITSTVDAIVAAINGNSDARALVTASSSGTSVVEEGDVTLSGGADGTEGVKGLDVTTQAEANKAIEKIQTALNAVSTERSKLGAVQNRLEHTIANLGVAAENLTAAESRIRDVDMAQEMMEFTKNQILIQAGTAMLANANVRPQSVLQLLG